MWSTLKSRKGVKASGHQSGDDDLYDDDEMSELNKRLSAVSAVAGELSI